MRSLRCGAALLAAAALATAAFGLPPANAHAAGTAETTVTLKDADGEDVSAVVFYNAETGNWELGSPVRNIYAVDLTDSYYNPTWPSQDPVVGKSETDFSDGVIVSAYVNTVKAYDFYTKENVGEDFFGINGKNDKIAGTSGREEYTIYVYTHDAGENAAAFATFPGMFADGRINEGHMRVGDGGPDKETYLPARALDIIAHEYHHGVTTHFLTGSTYGGETGALKEAFSDVFGSLVEGHALSEDAFWTIGEDGVGTGKDFLRSMKEPQAPYVADMAHKYTGDLDRGGEHYNSTIISHLNYRIYTQIPDVLTRQVLGRLWFSTLKNLSGKSEATFADFTAAFRGAAARLPEEEGVLTAEGREKLADAVDNALFEAGLYEPDDLCTVTFEDGDGRVLKTERVRAGGNATPPDEPEKSPDEAGHYAFTGWEGSYTNVQGDVTVRATFRKEAHTFETEETPPTCEEAGQRRESCACGYTETETVPPEGHAWEEWSETKAPTYTEAGEQTRRCPKCGKTETQAVSALGLVQKFLDEMDAFDPSAPLESRFAALKSAYETYRALSDEEKTRAAEGYQRLLDAVHAYNGDAGESNETFEGAYRKAIGALSPVALAAALALSVFRRWGR